MFSPKIEKKVWQVFWSKYERMQQTETRGYEGRDVLKYLTWRALRDSLAFFSFLFSSGIPWMKRRSYETWMRYSTIESVVEIFLHNQSVFHNRQWPQKRQQITVFFKSTHREPMLTNEKLSGCQMQPYREFRILKICMELFQLGRSVAHFSK